jgi:HD superfamily phosphohydrolase
MPTLKRIRDPVHGLIVFDLEKEVDKAAWRLIDTPEFQRLRRIKQLGVSEFTFPGAAHTRFSHSIGVFHVARCLMKVAEKGLPATEWNHQRERTALLAALLHDIGHGPFSHAFENVEKKRLSSRGSYKSHETWTAEIIASREHSIRHVLEKVFGGGGGIADDIADLLTRPPTDIYAAIVSSSFDADRLDYLRRDRLMTGSGAGAIDFDWLVDNLRVVRAPVGLGEGDAEETIPGTIQTFAFEEKALQAVEAFILARYHLYSQVYLHRVTRGIEMTLSAFLGQVADLVGSGRGSELPVHKRNPLLNYFSAAEPTLALYLALDDAVVWNMIEACAENGPDDIRLLARDIRDRKLRKAIEIDMVNTTERDRRRKGFIDNDLKPSIGQTIFRDAASLSIYKDAQREDIPAHKRVFVKRADGSVVDIVALSKAVAALTEDQNVLRYYFADRHDYESVLTCMGGANGEAR